ncbi:hypothetical protein IAD21_00351 [Abditibacteriota bacterium]|nr:hypothetical protein IAD21_00351 [Abditibacteriota bacterium]
MKSSTTWSAISVALLASSCVAQNSLTTPNSLPATHASSGLLISSDFDSLLWPNASVLSPTPGVAAKVAVQNAGTIDSYKGEPSRALVFSSDFSGAKTGARAGFVSGALPFKNNETNLGKITLGFDVWQSELHPIRAVIQSLDAVGKVSGSRFAVLVPPVAGAWFRFSLDLDQTRPLVGMFNLKATKIQLVWELGDEDGMVSRTKQELRVDNVSISVPALYVSANGNDQNGGKTEQTAFATVQKAVDNAVPGDVISILDGTYNGKESAAHITKGGMPAAWITLRANPGAKPELRCDGWNVIKFDKDPAYWEIRGLTVRGKRPTLKIEDALADGLLKEKDGKPYYGDPLYNSNGISIDDRTQPQNARPHHIRIIDNDVFDNAGGGISAINCDYITVENNRVRDNCHPMRYAGSGISLFHSWNFDNSMGYRMFVVGNVSSGNRTFVPWTAIGKVSDGNGIIIDDNIQSQVKVDPVRYEGRTLVQNNLCFGNGGSGIHAYASRFVDIVNNTGYFNAQSPELSWRQIWAGGKCDDVRLFNNILYAQKGKPLNFSVAKDSTNIVYADNLVFGEGDNAGENGGGLGTGSGSTDASATDNMEADPKFVHPSLDAKTANFRLQPGSPGIDKGKAHPGAPLTDLTGRKRPQRNALDVGAYEMSVK